MCSSATLSRQCSPTPLSAKEAMLQAFMLEEMAAKSDQGSEDGFYYRPLGGEWLLGKAKRVKIDGRWLQQRACRGFFVPCTIGHPSSPGPR